MSLEESSEAVEKSRHPVLVAVAVVALVVLAAMAYTFIGATTESRGGLSAQAATTSPTPISQTGAAPRP